jgi:hypothetical protein
MDVAIRFKGAGDQDELIAAVLLRRLFQADEMEREPGKVLLRDCASFLTPHVDDYAEEDDEDEDDELEPVGLDDELEPEDDD